MSKDELKVDHFYKVRHSSGIIKVKLVEIQTTPSVHYQGYSQHRLIRAKTRYFCINMGTGKNVLLKSAQVFLSEVIPDTKTTMTNSPDNT